MKDREIRNLEGDEAEVRALGDSRTIEGYGIVFNSLSQDLGGFQEVILPEAVEGVLEQSDIFARLDHNKNRGVLARSMKGKGSMKLAVDSKGVKYSFEAPKFDLGDEVLEGVRRGDIRGSSFSFKVSDGQKWEKRSDGAYVRTITKFDVISDMSPVYTGAYPDASLALRSLDEFRAMEAASTDVLEEIKPSVEENAPEPEVETRADDLTEYFAGMRKSLEELDNQFKEEE